MARFGRGFFRHKGEHRNQPEVLAESETEEQTADADQLTGGAEYLGGGELVADDPVTGSADISQDLPVGEPVVEPTDGNPLWGDYQYIDRNSAISEGFETVHVDDEYPPDPIKGGSEEPRVESRLAPEPDTKQANKRGDAEEETRDSFDVGTPETPSSTDSVEVDNTTYDTTEVAEDTSLIDLDDPAASDSSSVEYETTEPSEFEFDATKNSMDSMMDEMQETMTEKFDIDIDIVE